MQAIYYYPTKLSITPDEAEDQDEDGLFDGKWRKKAERLQARRWKRVNAIEKSQEATKVKRLQKIQQTRWLQRHGWPRVSQPMV